MEPARTQDRGKGADALDRFDDKIIIYARGMTLISNVTDAVIRSSR
jgi:hypothetical protein